MVVKQKLTVEMDGDEAKLWSSFIKTAKAEAEVEAGAKKIASATAAAAKQQVAMGRAAQRVLKQIQSPQEKYNAKVKNLSGLLKANKLSQDQYGRAVAQTKTQMIAAGQATDEARRRKQQQAAATQKATQREQEFGRAARQVLREIQSPQERYNVKLKQLGSLLRAGKLEQQQFASAVRKAKVAMAGAADTGKRAFGPGALRMVSNLAGALGLTGGVAGAVVLVRNEYEALLGTMQRAKDASMSVGNAEIKALRNLMPKSAAERDEYIKSMEAISKDTGLPLRDLHLRATSALSARGELPKQAALDAVRESARLVPESSSEGTEIAGAALDLMKIGDNKDPKANLGQLMAIGQTARVTDVGKLAEQVAPAVKGLTARGGTKQEAGAIWSSLTGGMTDKTGRRSSQAIIEFGEKLNKFLPEMDAYKYEDGQRVLHKEGTGLQSPLERIRYLQQNPESAEEFLTTTSLGGGLPTKSRASLEELVKGEGSTAAALDNYLQRIPKISEAKAGYERSLQIIRSGETQRTATFSRSVDTTVEGLGISDQGRARRGILQEKFVPILQDAGMGALGSKLSGLQGVAGGGMTGYARQIEARRAELLAPRKAIGMGYGGVAATVAREPSDTDRKQAGILQQLLDSIKKLDATDAPKLPKQAAASHTDAAEKLADAGDKLLAFADRLATTNPTLGTATVDT